PVPHLYEIEATNPCGEQSLGPYESCCLGSINLAEHLDREGTVDWPTLKETVELATRFLDDVVDANAFVPEVPQLEQSAHASRRIGLGIMGLADLLYHARLRYGSPASLSLASSVAAFIRYHAMLTSIELARERGAFPAIAGSIYDPQDLRWEPPESLEEVPAAVYLSPPLEWRRVMTGLRKHGIRNAAQLTVAPTGTLSTVAGCEGYGCEPVFALAYQRYVQEDGRKVTLEYTSPMFSIALMQAGLNGGEIDRVLRHVIDSGSCQDIDEIPPQVREVFVIAQDVTAEEHVLMQAALQAYVDSSISKTVNLPPTASPEDVGKIFQLAWEEGCKGVTVYVTGSRQEVVLETHATKLARSATAAAADQPIWNGHKKPRPDALFGKTYRQETPFGKTFVTINANGEGQPFEVFINTAKAGSEMAAVSEALGRLMSYILRLASPVEPLKRLQEVYRQLWGIGGARSSGFGKQRVRSLPDAVAQVLGRHLDWLTEDQPATDPAPAVPDPEPLPEPSPWSGPRADLCPECGEVSLVTTQGCASCIACGYSEC
ncbi:MAG: ribonucleoside-diphosphate reductase, adenosylcobalamin-dependent, partial [Chloroflexi bacterium]|nr:ribonucleoside-diphosphate reductase, adenosylcobalamin-dependent [Chloroflexota bacterium]